MGTYVDKSSSWGAGNSARVNDANGGYLSDSTESVNVILQKWRATEGYISDLLKLLIEGPDGLIWKMNENVDDYGLPDEWDDDLKNFAVTAFDRISSEGRITINPLQLEEYNWPTDKPVLGVLKQPPDIDTSYTEPTLPDDVDPSLNYQETPYISDLHDKLFELLYNGITDGDALAGSSAVEDALWDRGRDKQRVSNSREWNKAMDAVGSSGFNFSGGAEAGVLLSVSNEMSQQDENLNNDILVEMARLALQHNQFLIDKSMGLENILRDYFSGSKDRVLKAEEATARFILDKFSEKTKTYIAQWQGIRESLQAKVASADVVVRYNETVGGIYDSQAKAYTTEIELIVKKIDAEVRAYEAEITGKDAMVRERSAWWKALTDEQRNHVAEEQLKLTKFIEHAKVLVNEAMAAAQFREKTVEAMADVATQTLASALSAVSTAVNHQTQHQESRSENWNHHEALNEYHNFTE